MLGKLLKNIVCISMFICIFLLTEDLVFAENTPHIVVNVGEVYNLYDYYKGRDLDDIEIVSCISGNQTVAQVVGSSEIKGVKHGNLDLEVSYLDSAGTACVDYLDVDVRIPTGVYRIKKSNSNDYLSMNSLLMTGNLGIEYDVYQTEGNSMLEQLWYIEELEGQDAIYKVKPYIDRNMILELGYKSSLVVESHTSYINTFENNGKMQLSITDFRNIHNDVGVYLNDTTITGEGNNLYYNQKFEFELVENPPEGLLICDNKEGIVESSSLGTLSNRHISRESTKSLVDLKIKVLPYGGNMENISFVWSSRNENIATVNSVTGAVTGVSQGTTTIVGTAIVNATIYQVNYPVTILKYKEGLVSIKNFDTNNNVFSYEVDSNTTHFKSIFNDLSNDEAYFYICADLDGYYQFAIADDKSTNSYINLNFFLGISMNGNKPEVKLIQRTLDNIELTKWKIANDSDISSSLDMIYPKSTEFDNYALMINSNNNTMELAIASKDDYEFCWSLVETNLPQKRFEWYIHPMYDSTYLAYFNGDVEAMKSFIMENIESAISVISEHFDITIHCEDIIEYEMPDNMNVAEVDAGKDAPADSTIILADMYAKYFSGQSALYKNLHTYALYFNYDLIDNFGKSEPYTGGYWSDRIIYNKTKDREPYATLHELVHAIGTQDHSHIGGSCGYSHVCAICAPLDSRRPESCIMDEDNYDPNNPFCDDCKKEIYVHLYNHHLVDIE